MVLVVVKVPEGEERDYLVAVRLEKIDRDEIHALCKTLIDEINSKEPWSHLPPIAPVVWLNDWLVRCRRGDL